MTAPTPIVCTGLAFAWPDGTAVLDGLDLTLPAGRTGLVGRNGGGKSTLLRLVAGELQPTSGTISRVGEVAYLPQRLPLETGRGVDDLLGIADRRAALAAITAGEQDPERLAAQLTVLDDDWDVEARAQLTLDRLGLPTDLDRAVGELSGGEAVLVGLAGVLLRHAPVSLLDEPTNNLDTRAREILYDAVEQWNGSLVVVSHDRELLERVDQIVELRDGAARTFGGPFSAYQETIEAEQETAARLVRAAEGELAREKRQYQQAQETLARRLRTGRTAEQEKRVPKIVAHARKREAQVSAGKYRLLHAGRLSDARTAVSDAELAVRDDARIRVDLPATELPAGRDVLRLGQLTIRGPERIGLVGTNGSGKTTLLEAIAGRRPHPRRQVETPGVPVGYLPQRLDVLDDAQSVLANVRRAAPSVTPHQARAQLARFLVRGDRVSLPAGTLSGGERFRVSLACLLLAEPAPQLLLLDEPTNNLDLDSVAQLTDALGGYRGALLVASHDQHFLADVGVRRVWQVSDLGPPTELPGPA